MVELDLQGGEGESGGWGVAEGDCEEVVGKGGGEGGGGDGLVCRVVAIIAAKGEVIIGDVDGCLILVNS